jgi:hypothetical protein
MDWVFIGVLATGTLGLVLLLMSLNLNVGDRQWLVDGHDRAEHREWHWYWNKDRNKIS